MLKPLRIKRAKKFAWGIGLIVVVAVGLFSLVYFSGVAALTNPISLTSTTFTPVRINKINYIVRDAYTGAVLPNGNITKTPDPAVVGHFLDPTFTYPKIDVFNSQPFITDSAGNYLTSAQQSNLVSQRVVVGGNVYFITEYYMGIDIGVRTYANFDTARVQSTNILSPLDGIEFNRPGCYALPGTDLGSKTWTLTSDPDLKGRLLMSVDVGSEGWASTPSTQDTYGEGYAQITTSLEKIDFVCGYQGTSAATAYTFNAAIQKCRTNYGNSKVSVTPVINLQALSNYLVYSYDQVQEVDGEDVTIKVETTSAQIGFLNAFDAQMDQYGIIPNTFDSRFKVSMPSTTKTQDEPRSATKDGNYVEDQGLNIQIGMTGHVSNFVDITGEGQTLGGDVTPYPGVPINLNAVETIQIDLNDPSQFTLPQNLQLRTDFDLQPKTTIKVVQAEVRAGGAFWDNQGLCQITKEDTLVSTTTYIKWPYALNIENVYGMKRICFKIACLTENDVSVIAADGTPYDVSKITDFALNSILNDPRNDELFVKQITNFQDTAEIWSKIFASATFWTIIIVVIVVIVSVIALSVFLKMRGGGGFNIGKFLGGGGSISGGGTNTTGGGSGYIGGQPQPNARKRGT